MLAILNDTDAELPDSVEIGGTLSRLFVSNLVGNPVEVGNSALELL